MSNSSEINDWDQLVERFYNSIARFDPMLQLKKNWELNENIFSQVEDDQIHAKIVLLEMMLSTIDEFPVAQLDSRRKYEQAFIYKRITQRLVQMLNSDERCNDPQLYLPYGQLIQLVSYSNSQFANVLETSLKVIPERLRTAKTYLKTSEGISDICLLAAIEEIKQNEKWLNAIPELKVVKKYIGNPKRLKSLIDDANNALKEFSIFLHNECLDLVKKDSNTIAKHVKSNFKDLYEVEESYMKNTPDLIESNNLIKYGEPRSDSELAGCAKISIFSSFSCHFSGKNLTNNLTPVIAIEQVFNKDQKATQWLSRLSVDLEKVLPIRDRQSLIWHDFKKFSQCFIYLKESDLLNQAELVEFEDSLDLLAYLDYQVNWKKQEVETIIEQFLEKDNIENLIILVLKTPGFYWAAQQYVKNKR